MSNFHLALPAGATRGDALDAIARAAELWGAFWRPIEQSDRGEVHLSVAAGLRRGTVTGQLEVARELGDRGELELRLTVERGDYRLHRPSVALLTLAAAGGLTTMVWPFVVGFYPAISAIAPIAIMLAVGGWFVVAANQRALGIEDFLALVLEEIEAALEPPAAIEE